jgi:rhodanese-related sulfurtransferase
MELEPNVNKQPALPIQSRLWKMLWQAALLLVLAAGLALGFNHFRSSSLPLVADWSPAARLKSATGKDMIIPVEKAVEFFDTREAVFVDARSPEEYAAGHIAGAINLPFEDVHTHIGAFFSRFPERDAIVITYCDGESCSLSEDLALLLQDAGYMNVRVIINGWSVWKGRGFPIAGGQAPGGPS